MKTKQYIILILGFTLFLSCATNPFTGKKTLALPGTGNSTLFPAAFQQYGQTLSDSKIVTGTSQSEMITRIGKRITVAAERWLDANGNQGYLKDYKWEYTLIDQDVVNAWAMPGGKVAFYTGILPIANTEARVAAIMGHEVAHAMANHGQQRMSAGMIQQGISLAGNIALQDPTQNAVFNQSFGIGSQVLGILPFSRSHEAQSDEIGIMLMAIAGYNPDQAAELWKRMKANSAKGGGEAPPEFLSTHPSNDSRIAKLTALAPKAKEEAKKFGVTSFKD